MYIIRLCNEAEKYFFSLNLLSVTMKEIKDDHWLERLKSCSNSSLGEHHRNNFRIENSTQ